MRMKFGILFPSKLHRDDSILLAHLQIKDRGCLNPLIIEIQLGISVVGKEIAVDHTRHLLRKKMIPNRRESYSSRNSNRAAESGKKHCLLNTEPLFSTQCNAGTKVLR